MADRDFNLWTLMHQTAYAIFKAREKELSQHGISPVQALVLFVLDSIGGKGTPTELAKWLFREPHTVSNLLNRMQKEGLINREKGANGRPRVNITVTEKGKKLYALSLHRESLWDIMSCLSEEERQQLWSILEKLRVKALKRLTTTKKLPFP